MTILTLGTRGDVQPYIALGLELQRAGHEAKLGTSVDFEGMVADYGLPFAGFDFSIRGILNSPEGREVFESKRAAIRLYRKVSTQMPGLMQDIWSAAQESDLILYHPKILNGADCAEKLGVPAMVAFYLPALSLTRAFPAPFIPGPISWGGLLNRLSHWFFLQTLTLPYHRMLNRWRGAALGLPPLGLKAGFRKRYGPNVPKLYGFSRHVVPRPSDWPESAHITGQWFLNAPGDWEFPPELARFLKGGSPPLLISFGSISGRSPQRTTELVVKALIQSGQRGLLVGGWGGLQPTAAPGIFFQETVPYDRVLEYVCGAVHHGGAGSTGETLRAGKPTLVCPFFGDQPFWGHRVHALGVGPQAIPQKKLTVEKLAEAFRLLATDERMRRQAAALGEQIRSEDGVGEAVRLVESYCARAQ